MNANIILSGNSVDGIGAFARGQAARAQSDQIQRQNALQGLYQERGAQILAGDQGALNALAQHNPTAALEIQGYHQQMAQRDQEMRLQVQQYAKSLSREQAAQQAAEIESGVKRAIGFYQAGDLQGLNALLQSVGEQPLQDLEQFPAVAAMYGDALDALKSVETLTSEPKPADEYQRYVQEEQDAGRTPLTRVEYKRAAQKTQRIDVGPDGSVSLVEGFGGDEQNAPPDLKEGQAKNTGFLIRVTDSNDILNQLEDEGLSFLQQNAEVLPFGLGNYLVSDEFQKFDQARRDFVNAILRRESGAVISDAEFANAEKQYFPVPGDSAEVIAQKRQNRQNAIEGIRAGSGPGAAYADQLEAQDRATEVPEAAPDYLTSQDADLWDFMTPEERGAILMTYRGQK